MNRDDFIFRDPHGRRWRHLSRSVVIGTAMVAVIAGVFLYSLLVDPRLRPLPATPGHTTDIKAESVSPPASRPESPAAWARQTASRPPVVAAPLSGGVRLGFLDDDTDRALASLLANADALTHIAPPWFRLTGMPPRLEETPDRAVKDIAAERQRQLMPMLTNLVGDEFDPEAIEEYLRSSPKEQRSFALDLTERLQEVGARGVVIAWEQIDPAYRDALTRFIGLIRSELRGAGLELWLCVPVGNDLKVFDLDALASNVDRFVAMLYYETGEKDEAGPIASLPWFREWLDVLVQHGDPTQWVVSLGTFGYDWPAVGASELVSFYDTMARAASAEVKSIDDPAPYEGPSFSYEQNGIDHSVWFLDATTFRNQQRLVLERHLGGIGIDRLGTEDPLVWTAVRCGLSCKPEAFETIPVTDALGMVGTGDFIEARIASEPGQRTVRAAADGNWGSSYVRFPRTSVVTRRGDVSPRRVAFTFDDGPDPEWTPQILDILKSEGVKATFFVTGDHASANPDLVRRIIEEGHEIGNHTFSHLDLTETGPVRMELELNATQRAIEEITGRSTLLFRPPYDADRTPHSTKGLAPLITAQGLGYLSAMASIDPLDWERPPAERILERVQAARPSGNVVLMHDAGGDRSETVAALPRVIAWFKARGDEIVSLHDLLGVPLESLMPAIPPEDSAPQRLVAGTGINLLQILERGFWGFLMGATALLFLRTLLVVGLALRRARREGERAGDGSGFAPPVSAVIAAYNEEKVIAHTLGALLASRYGATIEAIVVDDGSTDRTAAIVADLAKADPRIRLVRQTNQGKAMALRAGLDASRHDFIVTLDADTQFAPDTIAELIRPMSDPRVGAVSGHIQIGNRANLLGQFQNLEYLSAFNLDRRAFDVLNAITVVPGAASAFRAQAIREAGGIQADTMAEDTDLTLSLHRAGYRVRHTRWARAVTEAPQSMRALFRQRKRWSFGTIQCLWKHRALLFNPRFGWLGLFAVPGIWFFQVFLVALLPFLDLWLGVTLLRGESGPVIYYAALFLIVDLILAVTACRLEGEPLSTALLVLPMRLIYRPLLSLAILASLHRALRGSWMAWGLQERWGAGAAKGRRRLLSRLGSHRLLSVGALIALLCLHIDPSRAETAVPAPQAPPTPRLARLVVPETGAYTGAYIDFGDYEDEVTLEKIDQFSARVGKRQAIVGFSNYWGRGHFPMTQAQIAANAGAVPLIYWNPWESQADTRTTRFDIARIEKGELDAYIDAWARDAMAYGKPILVSWGLEMNGNWFPWSGFFHGGGEPVPGSDPPRYQGPESFKRAYRHVVDRVRAAGADNISWVFHTNNSTDPDQPWNHMASYYPGSEYADWIGMSAYGKQYPTEHWITVDQSIVSYYQELAALDPGKPIILAEWGVGEFPPRGDTVGDQGEDTGGDKGAWIADAFATMEGHLPRLKAAVFWHERWRNGDLSYSNLRVTSSMNALNAYRAGVASPFWLATPLVSDVVTLQRTGGQGPP